MALQSLKSKQASFVRQSGRAILHQLFPKEFEHYFFSFELIDFAGERVDYFSFPILPSSFSEEHTELTNIKKTMGGVISIKNATFTPKQITIRGNFGKSLKLLLGRGFEVLGFRFQGYVFKNGRFEKGKGDKQFASFAKTGYGCVKIIEEIKDKSKALKDGQPLILICYNSMTGNNYVVDIKSFTHAQDENQFNMLPTYTLTMTAVGTLSSLTFAKEYSSLKNLATSILQAKTNALVRKITASF